MQRQEHLVPSETNKGDFSLRVVFIWTVLHWSAKELMGHGCHSESPKAGEKTLEELFFYYT